MLARTNPDPVRIGVIGAGIMGQNHARVYNTLKNAEITAIVDVDTVRAAHLAGLIGCESFADPSEIIGRVDAVSIATPSVTHRHIGEYLLANDVHCLIEKPLATNREDCQALIDAAAKSGTSLQVGHIERFNPAVQKLAEILGDDHPVYAIDSHRMSAASKRITDVDVVLDLMIHDLDIILWLMKRGVKTVDAQGVFTHAPGNADYATALLTFDNGAMASVTASRITQSKIRTLNVTSELGFIQLDFIDQKLAIFAQGRDAMIGSAPEWGNYAIDMSMERVLIRNAEPLSLELGHFLQSVIDRTRPLVTGEDALAALELVWSIQTRLKQETTA